MLSIRDLDDDALAASFSNALTRAAPELGAPVSVYAWTPPQMTRTVHKVDLELPASTVHCVQAWLDTYGVDRLEFVYAKFLKLLS